VLGEIFGPELKKSKDGAELRVKERQLIDLYCRKMLRGGSDQEEWEDRSAKQSRKCKQNLDLTGWYQLALLDLDIMIILKC